MSMSLPSQEVLNDIKDLISEITGFQEGDDNFAICERYCLSHVVHHTYPFVNRTTVKNLVKSYISRFYGHGYFRVSQELNNQIKSFLNNTKLFEKNPQYDIQWCLLSLVISLSSNLTSLKKLPELLPIDNEESEKDDFNWKEYLLSDLPQQESQELSSGSEDLNRDSDISEEKEEEKKPNEESVQTHSTETTNENDSKKNKDMEVIFDNRIAFNSKDSSESRRKKIQELLDMRKAERDIENDYICRSNITEKFDSLMSQEGITRKSQFISEFELMENILFQFQTGERILLQKGFVTPALTSVTQETLGGYLESLQPYFKIIRCFKDFDAEVTEARYLGKSCELTPCSNESHSSSATTSTDAGKRKMPNVLCIYNVMLRRALEPFQSEVAEIVENLGYYTLIQMEHKLKPHYFDLNSLFYIHNLATKNWKQDCNWMSSIRILSVLYNAIMDATSTRMSFLYLNLFLHCFQVYLEVIDSWISTVDLIDPFEEFIVARSVATGRTESSCLEYEIRPYKTEIEDFGEITIIDFISEKMIQVAASLEVLRRLNRFVSQETPEESSFRLLLKTIDEKVRALERVELSQKKATSQEKRKKRNIFTVGNTNFGLERDNGGGDPSEFGSFLMDLLKGEEEEEEERKKEPDHSEKSEKAESSHSYCEEMINSMVKNPFFKMAFDNIGMKQVQKKLDEAKAGDKDEGLFLVRVPKEENSGIYPLHKIITEAVHSVLGNRVSGTCSLVKDIVLKECHLLRHLSLLRSVLLFSDSHLIQPFILALFNQPVIWGSSYSLSLHLKECVRSFYKDYANALSVILTKSASTKCENILQVIDVITVSYEVKWPLTLILTPEALTKYNEIFRLALKLKWAHWALCSLHFNGKAEAECDSSSSLHRLRLLRFWLLSDLGRVHNYFLAQMVPLDLKLNSCEDLKAIINGHSEFLEKIHHNCLLGEKSPEGKKLILETLIPLCMELVFESEGADATKLLSIAKTFGSCHLHLTRLLASLEKNSSPNWDWFKSSQKTKMQNF